MDENETAHTNPFDLFVTECNDVDVEVRLRSIKKLSTIAVALDIERTKTELVPYLETLTEGIYSDDEVLMNLAEQLGTFLPFVGGVNNVHLILNILEKLAAIEENVVREKAIESLTKLACELEPDNLEIAFLPLVIRLTESDWFTSKSAGCALISVCYPKVSETIKIDLRNIYRILCQDESPLVRRSAAAKLTDFVKVLEIHHLKDAFVPVFDNLSKDDQDSVRVLAVDVGIGIASRLQKKEVEDIVLTTLTELCGDASWRVRYQVANHINDMQLALGYQLTRKYLVLIFQNLVHDTEPQVREVSAQKIVRFCEILQETFVENEENAQDDIDPTILNMILPLIQYLDQDANPEVKEALANVITSLSPILGIESTKSFLLPLVTSSLLNDSSKVKENIISNLNNIITVIGIADIGEIVLGIVADLVNNSASVWRSRRNLVVTINYMAKQSNKEYFDEHLKPLYQKLLGDDVYAVRITAPLILPILIKQFGMKWAKDSLVPDFLVFAEHKHYLYRFVCLFCIDELVAPTLEPKSEENRLGYLEQLRDQVCDEDFKKKVTALLNRIRKSHVALKAKLEEQWVLDCLNNLQENEIPDDNVRRYAEDTIEMFAKYNDLHFTNVVKKEIDADDVYLEGALDLLNNHFFGVLRGLSTDPVPNVQLKVGQTLRKIRSFEASLRKEFDNEWVKSLAGEDFAEEEVESSADGGPEIVEEKTMENEIMEILEEKFSPDS